ncbi:MAG: hypothetical protein JRF41_13015, partial [Deltaproteobacteria bacterium]|nr:hypothetical protein [Deltaproteobacteria bacterium]
PSLPPVPRYMGGMPVSVYAGRGFEPAVSYHDPNLRACLDDMLNGSYGTELQKALQNHVDAGADLDEASEITVCVKRFG